MKFKIGYFPSGPHPWRPQWPIPKFRLIALCFFVAGTLSALGALASDWGHWRRVAVSLVAVGFWLAGVLISLRASGERILGHVIGLSGQSIKKKKLNRPPDPTPPGHYKKNT
jgi:hypothetical protein